MELILLSVKEQVRDLLFLKEEINFKERDKGTIGTYNRTMSQELEVD